MYQQVKRAIVVLVCLALVLIPAIATPFSAMIAYSVGITECVFFIFYLFWRESEAIAMNATIVSGFLVVADFVYTVLIQGQVGMSIALTFGIFAVVWTIVIAVEHEHAKS